MFSLDNYTIDRHCQCFNSTKELDEDGEIKE